MVWFTVSVIIDLCSDHCLEDPDCWTFLLLKNSFSVPLGPSIYCTGSRKCGALFCGLVVSAFYKHDIMLCLVVTFHSALWRLARFWLVKCIYVTVCHEPPVCRTLCIVLCIGCCVLYYGFIARYSDIIRNMRNRHYGMCTSHVLLLRNRVSELLLLHVLPCWAVHWVCLRKSRISCGPRAGEFPYNIIETQLHTYVW